MVNASGKAPSIHIFLILTLSNYLSKAVHYLICFSLNMAAWILSKLIVLKS